MSMDYVRRAYNVPAKRGMRVRIKAYGEWCNGTITSATHHVRVKPDPWPRVRLNFHPTDTDHLRYPNQSQEKVHD